MHGLSEVRLYYIIRLYGWKIYVFLFVILMISGIGNLYATEPVGEGFEKSTEHSTGEGEKKFDAGRIIIEHVIDSHEWHIAEIGETPISIPLPIILIDEGKLVMFSSSRFHHGHDSYKGYRLMSEEPYKGKIVESNYRI